MEPDRIDDDEPLLEKVLGAASITAIMVLIWLL